MAATGAVPVLATATIHKPDVLHTAIVVGPDSLLAERIARGLRRHGLTVLRARQIDSESCDALAGATGCVIVSIAQTSDKSSDFCKIADEALPAPRLRVVAGRLNSVTFPTTAVAILADVLAGAGVHISAAMTEALNPPA